MTARDPGPDRRHQPTRLLNVYFLHGRRRGPRRTTEDVPCYIDRPGARWVAQIVWLLLAGLVDAVATHHEVRTGLAIEANPLMRTLMEAIGLWGAWGVKLVATLVGAWCLLAHVRWRYARVGIWLLNIYYAWILWLHAGYFL